MTPLVDHTRTHRATADSEDREPQLLLSVVVPVFNQAQEIGANLEIIRQAVADGLHEPFELIVVSDGSLDGTAEEALERAGRGVRVVHYDRNLGKGYAIKVGALEARGTYIAYIDADLDLDPTWLPNFVETAERERLDFAIGSKRHPESLVYYPPSRRIASWLYQQLVRLLFRLNVRDTQVGLKVFRREIADQVLPLLFVKRYAFDLELLAVSRALGFKRIKELPISLDYRFTGSGVRSRAVLRALVDTLAVFYRLRVLRYYTRKRDVFGRFGWTRPRSTRPSVTVISTDPESFRLDYEPLRFERVTSMDVTQLRAAGAAADTELLAFVAPECRPASNWLSSTAPFLSRPELAAVATSTIAPITGTIAERAAAAVRESRLGGGSMFFRFTPGNIRFVDEFPAQNLVVRREAFLSLQGPVVLERLVERLTERGDLVLYTPESTVLGRPVPLLRPHLRSVLAHGTARGRAIRRRGMSAVRISTVVALFLVVGLFVGAPLAFHFDQPLLAVAVIAAYAGALAASGLVAALRFRSLAVGVTVIPALALSHVVYALGAIRGLVSR